MYRFLPHDPPAGADALGARYRRTDAGPSSPSERWYNWAVVPRDAAATALGTVELSLTDNGSRASLAYVFGRGHWGRGYAYEACVAALDYLRARTPVRTVYILVDTRNERSIALAQRLGFLYEATIEQADYFKGATSNEYRYCLALTEKSHVEIQ